MNIWRNFWNDEAGAILSAEAVLLGTIGVAGATVGLGAASKAINEELTDVAFAIRSLDQSYCIESTSGCGAWTAGSQFIQTDVEESRRELARVIEKSPAPQDDAFNESAVPADQAEREFKKRRREHDQRMRDRRKSDGKSRQKSQDTPKRKRKTERNAD